MIIFCKFKGGLLIGCWFEWRLLIGWRFKWWLLIGCRFKWRLVIGYVQMPVNDDRASSLMIGLTLETSKAHIVRAILESLAFRFALLYETVLNETKTPLSALIK